jgi:peptide methionine sulfoxide reductase msrA/msrB
MRLFFMVLGVFCWFSVVQHSAVAEEMADEMMNENVEVATLAGGCFWCLESEFEGRDGIVDVRSGYTGGDVDDPSYRQVTRANTGHAEAIEITFDPAVTSFRKLLEHFMTVAHDPTQVDGQWVDKGPQYRSGIFYHNDEQKKIAEDYIAELTAAKRFKKPITTEVTKVGTFWEAEEYHQDYYEKYEQETGRKHIRTLQKKMRPKW